MDKNNNESIATIHGDGSATGSNVEIIKKATGNRFQDKYNQTKITDTEQLLRGIPEFVMKDLALYMLFDNHPKHNNYHSGVLETYLNQINLKHIKDNKMFDLVQWCKATVKAREEGIEKGYAFLDYCDNYAKDNEFNGYLDLVKNVKDEMPIDAYLKGLTPEDTLNYLDVSAFNYMLKKITTNKWLFEQCADMELIQVCIQEARNGDENALEKYNEIQKKITQRREAYYRINCSGKSTVSALDSGFTTTMTEEAVREENQRNLRLAAHGSNKFKFGHRWLNLVTGGGIESKQLMVYGAPSGNGKTTMMISSTVDMALYNGETVKTRDDLDPCLLYISAETGLNDIKGRYIKMVTGVDVSWDDPDNGEKIYKTNEEIEDLLVEASRILSKRTKIRIKFIQVPNNAYSKTEIMRDIELLRENEKLQVVGVIADYIKGFKPVDAATDMRIRIENTVADLRALAIECDCAVITASQVKADVSTEISNNRARHSTSVIPKNCPETVFSETKGINDVADFALIFAQTSNKYERNEVSRAVKYTHLEALVVKSRAGQHNNARCFIPYIENSQIAFQKDADVFDENGKPVWFTAGELEFIGDLNELEEAQRGAKGTGWGAPAPNWKKAESSATPSFGGNKEVGVMDDMPSSSFNNPELMGIVA